MGSNAKFWDRMAKKYARSPIGDEAAYQKKLEQTRSYLKPGMRLLEIGCGTGTTAIYHAPLVDHIDAIDISENMLDIAREKAAAGNVENISFKQARIEDLDANGVKYDLIMGHSILHLLDDKDVAIAKIHKKLKTDGIFVSSTACLAGVMPILRVVLPIGNFFGLLPKVNFFSPDELEKSIMNAGFEIITKWQPSKKQGMFVIARKVA